MLKRTTYKQLHTTVAGGASICPNSETELFHILRTTQSQPGFGTAVPGML